MTITLNDEQARLLSEVVQAGAARSPEEAVDQAVRAPIHRLPARDPYISRWITWPTCLRNLRSTASIWILSAIRFDATQPAVRKDCDKQL